MQGFDFPVDKKSTRKSGVVDVFFLLSKGRLDVMIKIEKVFGQKREEFEKK